MEPLNSIFDTSFVLKDGAKEYKHDESTTDCANKARLCEGCVGMFKSNLGEDVDLEELMNDKAKDDNMAEDIEDGTARLAQQDVLVGEHDVGTDLEYGYEIFSAYDLKTHTGIITKYKRTPKQLRLRALKLKKKKGDNTEVLYPIRRGNKVLKVYVIVE